MASTSYAHCCISGTMYSGKSTGYMTKVNDKVDAYISTPPATIPRKDSGVLYLPDAFGIWQNSKLIADHFAAKGYTCVIVDIFNGDSLTPSNAKNVNFPSWLAKGTCGNNPHTSEFIDPIVLAGIAMMRDLGFTRIGAVGYCFGAKYAIRHLRNGIDCAFIAHPFGLEEEEVSEVTGPVSVAAAEHDTAFTLENRYMMEKLLRRSRKPFQISVFSGVEHGFAVRGNPKMKAHRFAKEQAFIQAVAWFDCHLEAPGQAVHL